MISDEKKFMIDSLGFYRNYAIELICSQQSIDGIITNDELSDKLEKLIKFLKNTKLTKLSLSERFAYRTVVYLTIDEIYSSAYKKIIMDKSVCELIVSEIRKNYDELNCSDINIHYDITNWKYIPTRIYKLYIDYILFHIVPKKLKKFAIALREA